MASIFSRVHQCWTWRFHHEYPAYTLSNSLNTNPTSRGAGRLGFRAAQAVCREVLSAPGASAVEQVGFMIQVAVIVVDMTTDTKKKESRPSSNVGFRISMLTLCLQS